MRRFALLLIVLAATAVVFASPPTASQLMANAKKQAAREHKNIFVMFDASW